MVLPVPVVAPDPVQLPSAKEGDKLQELVTSTYTTSTLEFYLNGSKIELRNPNPHWTLLDFIRSQHGLKGTKLGCGEGGCGACTVVLQVADSARGGRIWHQAINACLYPLVGGKFFPLSRFVWQCVYQKLISNHSRGKACYHCRRTRECGPPASFTRATRKIAWIPVCRFYLFA